MLSTPGQEPSIDMVAEVGKVSGYRLQASGKWCTRKPAIENVTIRGSDSFVEKSHQETES